MTPDEKVDIVNEADEVIGSDGKWTLIQQSSDRQDAGRLVSPIGGHVSAGESEDIALVREAGEEYGLNSDISFGLVGKKIFNREVIGRKENHYFILYEIQTDQEPILNGESVGFERFSKDELKREIKEKPEKFGAAFLFVANSFYPELF